jgi:hypothetical protein
MYIVGAYEFFASSNIEPETLVVIDDGHKELTTTGDIIINTNKFATIINENSTYKVKYMVKENKTDYNNQEIMDTFNKFYEDIKPSKYFDEQKEKLYKTYKSNPKFKPGDEIILVKNSFPKEFTKIILNGEINNFSEKTFGTNYNIMFNKDYELSLVSSCYTTEGVTQESKKLTPEEVSEIME